MSRSTVLAIAAVIAGCSGCVRGTSPTSLISERPDSVVYAGAWDRVVDGQLVPVEQLDTLKLFDDSTYLVKSAGSNVWLGGTWHRETWGEYCGKLALSTLATPTCGAYVFPHIRPDRLQDPNSAFMNDGVTRRWDPL